ncbi:MAG: DoxX family protein, partial [Verrucomicrobiales bacterium]|nr:DoxX family protein [Verrucomicrobiales bacterium]
MNIITHTARLLLGCVFVTFGLNGFLQFIPPPLSDAAAQFMTLLAASGWLYVVKVIEVIGGSLLLANRFVPLALILLAPVLVNIFLFHLLLDRPLQSIGSVLWLLCWGCVAWQYRPSLRRLFLSRVQQPAEANPCGQISEDFSTPPLETVPILHRGHPRSNRS